ncbi:MAG: O-antigen ligase family protein [Gaiellaceae bacterium]
MRISLEDRTAITYIAAAVTVAAGAGYLLISPTPKAIMLLGALVLLALAVITIEYPLAIFAALVLLLGLFSEDRSDTLIPGRDKVWSAIASGITPAELLLALLVLAAVVAHLSQERPDSIWPGAPALAAFVLAATGIGSAIAFHQVRDGLRGTQPSITLFLALVAGYWLAGRYGTKRLLFWLVAASSLLLPQGLYNGLVLGQLSYYDASPIFLLGICSILVAFKIVDLAAWRLPYLVGAGLVIVLSLRRAIWIDIVVALAITGVWSRRSGFRALLAAGLGAVVVLELVSPGSAFSYIEHAVRYTTGAQGREFSTDYRHWETANAWMNVKRHSVAGIGPDGKWTLYNSFDGRFRPYGFSYLHNSYLLVWLRLGLLGLVAYVALFVTSIWMLLGRRLPLESIVVGAMMTGLAMAVYTASFLITGARWPTTVGLLLGIGLAARTERGSPEPTSD